MQSCLHIEYHMKKELTVRELAKMGGKARFKNVSKEERVAFAKKGAAARWGKRDSDVKKQEKHQGDLLG